MFRKRILALFMMLAFCLTGILPYTSMYVSAEETSSEGSELSGETTENSGYLLNVSVVGGGSIEILGNFAQVSDSSFRIDADSEIGLCFTAKEGYELKVTELNGSPLSVENGEATFIMPAQDSNLRVEFSEIVAESTDESVSESVVESVQESESVPESNTESSEEGNVKTISLADTKGGMQLSPEAVAEVLGGYSGFLYYEDLVKLAEAGYDVSGFAKDSSEAVAEDIANGMKLDGESKHDEAVRGITYASRFSVFSVLRNTNARSSAASQDATKIGTGYAYYDDPNNYPDLNEADKRKIYLYGQNSYYNNNEYNTIYMTRKFVRFASTDYKAFCIEPKKGAPLNGTTQDVYRLNGSNYDRLLKVLYYGFQGPEFESSGFKGLIDDFLAIHPNESFCMSLSKDDAYEVFTHCLASKVWGDPTWAIGLEQYSADLVITLEGFVDGLPGPIDPEITLTTHDNKAISNLATYTENGYQRTTTLKVNGDSRNTLTIPLPDGIELVDGSNRVYTTSATLAGGTQFCLRAAESYSGTYSSGNLSGAVTLRYQACIIFGTANDDHQDVGFLHATPYSRPTSMSVVFASQTGDLELIKASSNTTVTNGNSNYSLEGAKYSVYDSNNIAIRTITTDANGKGKATGLSAGTYTVRETTAPKGYARDTQTYTVVVPSGGTVTLNVKDVPILGSISITKASSDPDTTNGNPCYSLRGAVYTVYNSSNAEVGTITTDTNGKGSLGNLPLGTYTLKETTAPTGYYLDPNTYTANVNSSTAVNISLTDTPNYDPITVVLRKLDSSTGQAVALGDGSLAGAEFTIKYYAGLWADATADPATMGKTPTRTWVLKTDDDGIAHLEEGYKVSGDDFYISASGKTYIPRGTITIQETKAPTGYHLNDTVFVRQITNAGAEGVSTYNIPEVPEKVTKLTLTKRELGTNSIQAGVEFTHTKPDGTTEVVTTDSNGQIVLNGLTQGTHKIKETKALDGFVAVPTEVEFRVDTDNKVVFVTSNPSDGSFNSSVTADGDGEITFYNSPALYKIKLFKENEDGLVLNGAEFTLYSDEALTTVVARQVISNGTLTIEGLGVGKDYYLVETKAPQGYRLPVDANGKPVVYKVTVTRAGSDVFNFTVNGRNYTVSNTTGSIHLEGTATDRVIVMTIVNNTSVQLPATGSNMTIVLLAVGVLLMAGSYFFLERKRR